MRFVMVLLAVGLGLVGVAEACPPAIGQLLAPQAFIASPYMAQQFVAPQAYVAPQAFVAQQFVAPQAYAAPVLQFRAPVVQQFNAYPQAVAVQQFRSHAVVQRFRAPVVAQAVVVPGVVQQERIQKFGVFGQRRQTIERTTVGQ